MWAGRVLHAALSAAPLSRRAQSALTQLRGVLEEELEAIRGAGTWKSERVITSRQGPRIHVDGVSGGILNFCANNYLGLSSHPEVIQAGLQALEEFGAGLSSTRFICGTQSIHKDLEAKIACFHQREDAILYPSCFDANAGLFEALLAPQDAVLSDELNHASIIDGIRLCKAHKYRYRHLDMADLEAKLQEAQKHRLRLVATDGAFSMDGDIAPLREICHLASRYGALVFVDECHATGFLGATGRGTDELLGVMDQVTIINSTLGKALGGASGGYTTGPGPLVSLLRQRSRPYLFSNSLPPAVAGCASKALDLLMESNAIIQSMAAKTQRHLRHRLQLSSGPQGQGPDPGADLSSAQRGGHRPLCGGLRGGGAAAWGTTLTWLVPSRARIAPPSTLTKGPFGQPRPEALSPAAVLGLGWGKACACGREYQATVWKRADMLVCFILSGQAQPWDPWKNQAGAGALRAGSWVS
uniref:Glycine C-acetyltransferase n=1 Tax=Ailuropoda melanoleuca TaxID=9646 RepID=G1LUJ2_AILME